MLSDLQHFYYCLKNMSPGLRNNVSEMSLWKRNLDGCTVRGQACSSDSRWYTHPVECCVGSSWDTCSGFTEPIVLPLPILSACSLLISLLAFALPSRRKGTWQRGMDGEKCGKKYSKTDGARNGNDRAHQLRKWKWRKVQSSKNKSLWASAQFQE